MISYKNLIIGKLYLFQNHVIYIYLGRRITDGSFYFYRVTNVDTYSSSNELFYPDFQIAKIIAIVNVIMNYPADKYYIDVFEKPLLADEFTFCTCEDKIQAWWGKSNMFSDSLPRIVTNDEFIAMKNEYQNVRAGYFYNKKNNYFLLLGKDLENKYVFAKVSQLDIIDLSGSSGNLLNYLKHIKRVNSINDYILCRDIIPVNFNSLPINIKYVLDTILGS